MPKTTPAENAVVKQLVLTALDPSFPTTKKTITLIEATNPRVSGVEITVAGALLASGNAGSVSLSVLGERWTVKVADSITGKTASTVLDTHDPAEASAFVSAVFTNITA